ncbi:zinc ribbon domain-containing protein [Corallococcus sp. AB011P]|uniref:zinc ribbon domain-containing protein n=1 Tax=Corallococcus sp. AB011P TaxID=2316735 RepID=UPI001315A3C4|nr:zinc ribbon domain-containing protein [Corallococcus sp. AB011P]
MLTGLARCGLCGASYQLETSGKSREGVMYGDCYYNCRTTLRAGKKVCPGFRMRTEELDGAVLEKIADVVCTPERAAQLARRHNWPLTAEVVNAWRNFILRGLDADRLTGCPARERAESVRLSTASRNPLGFRAQARRQCDGPESKKALPG